MRENGKIVPGLVVKVLHKNGVEFEEVESGCHSGVKVYIISGDAGNIVRFSRQSTV